jgi:site-specific DNA recombinase
MQSAIADIAAGRAKTLICANMSRYSRDVEHQQKLRKAVRAVGGTVVFCDMDFDDTPEGDLAFSIMGGFAEYERKVIRSRTMRGKRKRIEEGQQMQRSRAPYGYHIVTHADVTRGTYTHDMLGRYILREDTSPVARHIFESYVLSGLSLPKICKKLNEERVATTGNGKAWHEPTLYAILHNPVYKGEAISGRVRCKIDESRVGQVNQLTGRPIISSEVRITTPEDQWVRLTAPAIISSELWEKAQGRLTAMRRSAGGSPRQLRMLSGMVFCPHCGASMTSRVQYANLVRYHYYCCTNHIKARTLKTDVACVGDLYAIARTEEAVAAAITDALHNPMVIQAAVNAFRERTYESTSALNAEEELRSIDKALERLRTQETAAVQAQIAGIRAGASPDAYAKVFADIAAERKDIENQRGLLSIRCRRSGEQQACVVAKPAGGAELALSGTLSVLRSDVITGAEKRSLVGTVVEKVICRKEGGDVYFRPEALGQDLTTDASRSTFQTTCVVCRIDSRTETWSRRAIA